MSRSRLPVLIGFVPFLALGSITGCPPPPECTVNAACSDGDVCTTDSCVDGVCLHLRDLGIPGCEGNPCSIVDCGDQVCNPVNSECVDCVDDNNCDDTEICVNGNCIPSCVIVANCDDGDPCTDEACVGGGCQYSQKDCDDTETCVNGNCIPSCVIVAHCDDGDPCTDEACVGGGCQYSQKDCDDGEDCNGAETCNPTTGACESSGIPCNSCDGVVCPEGSACSPDTGLCELDSNLVVARIFEPEEQIGILAIEDGGDELGVIGEKDEDGNLVKVTGASYAAGDETGLTVWFGNDGLPTRTVVSGGWVLDLGNYTDQTVDVTLTDPEGRTTFHPGMTVDPYIVSRLQELAQAGVIGAAGGSSPSARASASHSSITLSDGLEAASLGVSWGGCIGNTVQILLGGSGVPSAITGCTGAVLATHSHFTGNEVTGAAAQTLTVVSCAVGGASSCVGLGLSVGSTVAEHYETQSDHVASFGHLRGLVRDANTNLPLAGAQVVAVQDFTLISGDLTDGNGRYEVFLPEGTDYLVEVSKEGYLPVTYHGAFVVAQGVNELETLLQVDESYASQGDVAGTITNALNGEGVPDASIEFRTGINATFGPVVATAITDQIGFYSVSGFPGGVYTGEVSASGYETTYFTAICLGGQTTPNQNATISPLLSSGEIRIVLTWGSDPSDLDSHLTGPNIDGSRFHVYYSDLGSESTAPFAALDHDDVTSFGPETITIYQMSEGVYRYLVHDYSNRDSSVSDALSISGAEVKVFGEQGLITTLGVPSGPGTVWTVFDLDGGTGSIAPISTLSFVSDPRDIQANEGAGPSDLALLVGLPEKN